VGRAAVEHGLAGTVRLAGAEVDATERRELLRWISISPAAKRFELLGVVGGRAKADALAAADVFVLPSYAEGMPMAILEAMAAGMAIIATPVGSIGEAVTDGQEGFLVAPGDVEALAGRIAALDGDFELRRRMGQAARQTAERRFAIDLVARQVAELYAAVAGGRIVRESSR